MNKKVIGAIIASLAVIIIAVIFLQNNKDSASSQKSGNKLANNKQEAQIKFNGLATIINPEDKNCNSDSDCVLFQPDCEDCKFSAINKKVLLKYNKAKTEHCFINKPEKQCDIIFTGKLKCINSKCAMN